MSGVLGRAPGAGLRIRSFEPVRPWFQPGETAVASAEIAAVDPMTLDARLELLDCDRVVAVASQRLRVRSGLSSRRLSIALPAALRHGYGLRLALAHRGRVVRRATCELEALSGWWESPRHAALTDFSDPEHTAGTVRRLAGWHVTVVQFYDWMYRHYRYASPGDRPFRDVLGRRVSPAAVREGVEQCHERGIAALAYGSVYGAEREYIERHPTERVFDAAGRALSLGDTFYLTDLRPGSSWRQRLLREYADACRRFDFDGLHMDTYGEPHEGVTADGVAFRFADLYPGLIEEAAARLLAGGRRVLFNCVDGYPLDEVATAPAAALYLELWPPATRYRDVVAWIDRARRLGEGRAVVIAAYMGALREAGNEIEPRSGALEAIVLLTSLISAAGGYHQILADRDRALVEGYYPAALPLGGQATGEVRAAWRFSARFLHLLSDPRLVPEPLDGLELRDHAGDVVPISEEPVAGAVWCRASRASGGRLVISLVDLRAQGDDRWDAIRQPSPVVTGWRLRVPEESELVAMSPWARRGEPSVLRREEAPDGPRWELPSFRRWLVVAEREG